MKEDFKETKPLREKRSLILIANFKDGYAEDWHFAVPEAFKDALDIKWTERVVDVLDDSGNKIMITVLKKGQPILNENGTPKLKEKTEIKYFWTQGKEFNFKPGSIIYDTRLAYELDWLNALKQIKLFIQIIDAIPTETLIFKLYRPSKDFSGIEEIEKIECSQENFVAFLRSGTLPTSGNKFINLSEECEV